MIWFYFHLITPSLKYKNMTEELQKQFLNHLASVSIGQDIKWQMIVFASKYPFKDKKAKFFLTLKTNNEKLGFIYKYIVAAAYQYGVPKIYINETIKTKESYIYWKGLRNSNDNKYMTERRMKMYRSYYNLLIAVNQMIREKNSRKEKILNVMYKISENKNPN